MVANKKTEVFPHQLLLLLCFHLAFLHTGHFKGIEFAHRVYRNFLLRARCFQKPTKFEAAPVDTCILAKRMIITFNIFRRYVEQLWVLHLIMSLPLVLMEKCERNFGKPSSQTVKLPTVDI